MRLFATSNVSFKRLSPLMGLKASLNGTISWFPRAHLAAAQQSVTRDDDALRVVAVELEVFCYRLPLTVNKAVEELFALLLDGRTAKPLCKFRIVCGDETGDCQIRPRGNQKTAPSSTNSTRTRNVVLTVCLLNFFGSAF